MKHPVTTKNYLPLQKRALHRIPKKYLLVRANEHEGMEKPSKSPPTPNLSRSPKGNNKRLLPKYRE